MAAQRAPRYTPEQYLTIEREADYKSQYFDGEIFAMAGASPGHVLITSNVVIGIGSQFRGRPCRVYASDLRVKVDATGLYTYPDVVAVCGEPVFEDRRGGDTLTNPTVIIEVLSESTEGYDRGRKFENYRQIPSLQEYVLIAQEERRIERYARQSDGSGWLLTEAVGEEGRVTLNSIGVTLSLGEVYDKVAFA